MGSFGHFVFFTVKRNLMTAPLLFRLYFTYFTKWVRLVNFGF